MIGLLLQHRLRLFYSMLLAGDWTPPVAIQESNIRVSLTSWGPRLRQLPLVLLTLIQQKLRPKEIVVWLTHDDHASIDERTRNRFEEFGVRFVVCDDLKSHKKWLPMIEHGLLEPFVICDDDIFYPREWFASLVSEDQTDAYVGIRGHAIEFDANGAIGPYSSWKKLIRHSEFAAHAVFITGGAGAVIHPDRVPRSFMDRRQILSKCPQADDIWLNAMHRAAGIPGYKTRYSFPCLELPGTSEFGLAVANVDFGGNDVQIKTVESFFRNTLS